MNKIQHIQECIVITAFDWLEFQMLNNLISPELFQFFHYGDHG